MVQRRLAFKELLIILHYCLGLSSHIAFAVIIMYVMTCDVEF